LSTFALVAYKLQLSPRIEQDRKKIVIQVRQTLFSIVTFSIELGHTASVFPPPFNRANEHQTIRAKRTIDQNRVQCIVPATFVASTISIEALTNLSYCREVLHIFRSLPEPKQTISREGRLTNHPYSESSLDDLQTIRKREAVSISHLT